ncbi:MAG: hypothetical protein IIC80_12600 [Chloroflexi bacterium]|nr:hypothetical protein [Chloroflexota bacterium]MCI0770236.1 hypothetical protein [Chloroflexota bacterium]
MTSEEKPSGYNGHAYFTIDDIAAMLPGPARLMPEVGNRWWKVYYAAKEGNWPLAEFETKEVEELIDMSMITRPKYAEWMEPFIKDDLGAVKAAIKKQDWAEFEEVYHQAVKNANDYHKAADKPLLQWKLPEYPPPDMDLTPLKES